MDPELQGINHAWRVRCLTGFAGLSRTGYFGRGKQVQSSTVSGAITAIGKTIALAQGINPTKCPNSEKFLPRLQEMFEGWHKEDPPTMKKLPVEADIPEQLVEVGMAKNATEKERAVGDCALTAFYYLLRIGEYTARKGASTTNGGPSKETQTEQFKLCDVTFFGNNKGRLYQIPRGARDFDIMNAVCATLKLDNQKNGWKGVCINHEHNGDNIFCAIRALGRRYVHIRQHTADQSTLLSAYWQDGKRFNVTDQDIRDGLKWAAMKLDYPATRGIPVERIDTHSLRIGGACALALSGFSDTQIQKMGRWRGATFKEYIREELSIYSEGMSKAMKKKFGFVNIAAGVYHDVTASCVMNDYNVHSRSAAAA